MLFNSWEFLVFFILVYGAYLCLGVRAQNVLLLASSYFFYGWWDYRFTSLLAFSTVVDYIVGRRMPHASEKGRRRLLWISLATNLGILGFFKYFNFFADSFHDALQALGLNADFATMHVILPVGISFYTFQTLAYTIDVYRGRVQAERDFVAFAVYVCYFPQLVAGPIERAQRLLPQIKMARSVRATDFWEGTALVLVGLVKKIAIADFLAPIVEETFSESGSSGLAAVAGVVAFALQIYGDFGGYSSIARGVSRMMGIDLMRNFRHPYFASSITDFWRRWHISLSTWLRDYLYIPLGGNRHGRWRQYRNLMMTMLLGGLWHGSSWTFVVWGGIHGLALAVHKLWRERGSGRGKCSLCRVRAIGSWMLTMAVVLLCWVFFRASSFSEAFTVITSMGSPGNVSLQVAGSLAVALLLLLFIDVPQHVTGDEIWFDRLPWFPRGLVYAGLLLAVVILRRGDEVPFIYFQF